MKDIIEQSISVNVNTIVLWHALTDTDELENWWGDSVKIESKVGGKFQEKWEDDDGKAQMATGQVLKLKKNQEIVFSWKERSWPKEANTECSFFIEGKDEKSTLTVRHTGWETLPEDIRSSIMKDFKVGWTYHLKELKSYLDE